MSHSSGIPLSPELDQAFAAARTEGGVRFLKVVIKDDRLVEEGRHALDASAEADWRAVTPLLEPKRACYVLFRLDSRNMNGFEWVLCSYVPDGCPVKERMLYAATRDAFKRQLGYAYFADDLFGTVPDDITAEAYAARRKKAAQDAPLTAAELQAKAEAQLELAAPTSKEYVHSVSFPASADAQGALRQLASGSVSLVLLRIDAERETLELAAAKPLGDADALPREFSADEPRFAFFRFPHDHHGEHLNSVVFIYCCPAASKVKLKMLYSTVKSAAIAQAEAQSVQPDKKIEVQAGTELSANLLIEELHAADAAAATQHKPAFSKPAPPGKGKPRLIKK